MGTDDDQIRYEVTDKVAVITLNRPHVANAQTMELLDDLDAAWTRAALDDEVRVIVLRGNGKHFSSGHDLKSGMTLPDKITLEHIYALEARKYLEYSLRWRNVPKPSIASVQGKVIAGGLLLVWPCDLIVAFGLRQAKRAVNQTLDVQGFYAAIQSVFDIHQTGHGNALSVSGYPIITRYDQMKEHLKSQ